MGKISYEAKLIEMIKKYQIPLIDKADTELTSDWNIKEFEEKCTGKRVALWGAGDGNEIKSNAAIILREYATYLQGAVCVIDSNQELWGKDFFGLPIIPPEEIPQWDIEYIIISSSKRWIQDIYGLCLKYLEESKIIVPAVDLLVEQNRETNFYLYIHLLRQEYQQEKQEEEKQEKLINLIGAYLSIRDIYFAMKLIKEYIDKEYRQLEKMCAFKTELEGLLEEMKQKAVKEKRDVLILFLDRLNKEECFKADIFSDFKEECLVFTDANSTGLYTYESMEAIVTGKIPKDGSVYGDALNHSMEEAKVLQEAKKQNYTFYVESIAGYPIFEGKEFHINYSAFMSQKLWNALCHFCETQEPVLEYVYIYESHNPELCGYHAGRTYEELKKVLSDSAKYYRAYYWDCLRYIDNQITFYMQMLPKDMLCIIHSDHSFLPSDEEAKMNKRDKVLLNKQYCVEIPLFIRGAGMVGEYKELFSMVDFADVVNQIMRKEELKIPQRDIIQYQMEPIHNRTWRKQLIEEGMEKYIDEIEVYCSEKYRCLITHGALEEAEVYRNEDLEKSISQTEEGQSFIEKIRQLREDETVR